MIGLQQQPGSPTLLTLLPPPFAVGTASGRGVHYLYGDERRGGQLPPFGTVAPMQPHSSSSGESGRSGIASGSISSGFSGHHMLPALPSDREMHMGRSSSAGVLPASNRETSRLLAIQELRDRANGKQPLSKKMVARSSYFSTSWERARAAAARLAAKEEAAKEEARKLMEAKEAERAAELKVAQEAEAARVAKQAAKLKAARELAVKRIAEAAEKAAAEKRAAAAAAVAAAAAKAEERAAVQCDESEEPARGETTRPSTQSKKGWRDALLRVQSAAKRDNPEWVAAKERAMAGTLRSVLTRWDAARQAVNAGASVAGTGAAEVAAAREGAESAALWAANQAEMAKKARSAAEGLLHEEEEAAARAAAAAAAARAAERIAIEASGRATLARAAAETAAGSLEEVVAVAGKTAVAAVAAGGVLEEAAIERASGETSAKTVSADADERRKTAPPRGGLWAKVRGLRATSTSEKHGSDEIKALAEGHSAAEAPPPAAVPSMLAKLEAASRRADALEAAVAAGEAETVEAKAYMYAKAKKTATASDAAEQEAREAAVKATREAAVAREAAAAMTYARSEACMRADWEEEAAEQAAAHADAHRAAAEEAAALVEALVDAERRAAKKKEKEKNQKHVASDSSSWEAVRANADLGLQGLLSRAAMRTPDLRPEMGELVRDSHLSVPDKKRRVASLLQEAVRIEAEMREAKKLAEAEIVGPWQVWEVEEFVVPVELL